MAFEDALATCDCSTDTALTAIPDDCRNTNVKVSKMFFQQLDDTGNGFEENGTNDITLLTNWTGLPSATDSTKVVITPTISSIVFAATEELRNNENEDGAMTYDGSTPQLVTAQILDPSPDQVAALNSLTCWDNLTVYFVYANNKIQARNTGAATTTYAGLKISPMTVSTAEPSREGTKGSRFIYTISFYLKEGQYQNSAWLIGDDVDYNTDITPTT